MLHDYCTLDVVLPLLGLLPFGFLVWVWVQQMRIHSPYVDALYDVVAKLISTTNTGPGKQSVASVESLMLFLFIVILVRHLKL